MKPPKLFMILLGCTPKNRLTEQHDVFFGIGEQLKDLVPTMFTFWPESKETLHIDCWKEINFVDQYKIEIQSRSDMKRDLQLFFINLGGYLENEFEEYHHKVLIVAKNKSEAIKKVKNTLFYKKFNIKTLTINMELILMKSSKLMIFFYLILKKNTKSILLNLLI